MSRFSLTFILLLLSFSISAQVVKLSAKARPLNQVLIEMRDSYALKFSFDDKELSQFTITVNESFSTPQKALDFLLKPLAYTYILNQGVFVIYHQPPASQIALPQSVKRDFQLSGTVIDQQTQEALPYTFIVVNKSTILCDEQGRFSFVSKTDSVFRLTFRHLGHYVKDTLLGAGSAYKIMLKTSDFEIREVVVNSSPEKSMTITDLPGSIRANNLVAKNLPGNEGGSVFSLLRLLPGVYSAGEQTRDLVIWGGYEGQSEVTFDGFTLFGLKNFNDNISVVNPYMVKDVKVWKGGFGARYDDRVAGIVNVTGVDGNLNKPELKSNVSNLTLNTFASIPIKRKSALVFAYRQTFYNLYENQSKTQLVPRNINDDNSPIDAFSISPNYRFFDSNLKFSGKDDDGHSYQISLYGGKDRFSYSVANESLLNPLTTVATQEHTQLGMSAELNKQWRNGNRSLLRMTLSRLNATSDDVSSSDNHEAANRMTNDNNQVQEFKLLFENQIVSSSKHSMILGAGIVNYFSDFQSITTGVSSNMKFFPTSNRTTILNAYISDRLTLFPKLIVNPGVRVNLAKFSNRPFFQPRLSAEWQLSNSFRLASSWGYYHQFNSKVLYLEQYAARPRNPREDDNRVESLPPDKSEQIWTVSDQTKVPVVNSEHVVLGLYYQNKGFSASTEAFWKNTTGLSRWIRTIGAAQLNRDSIVFGRSYATGVDFMIRQQYKKHYAWLSYSYGETIEHFTNQIGNQFAPQDQRHELKGAVLLDFAPLSFSTNYVYGSGYPNYRGLTVIASTARESYHRLDASITYRFSPRKFKMQGGVTVLNVLNNRNLIFSDLVNASANNSDMFAVYSQAIPFTPMIFCEISF